ncbi:MAG: LL-diaminopimelate aminotransferase [bacterium]|nr:LL-diaminopimelate aminotransferase [bacterium]
MEQKFQRAKRTEAIPPYLFFRIDQLKREAIARGIDIINLGIGDPDLPTPKHLIDKLAVAANNPLYHQYPPYEGFLTFREAVAQWYKTRFNVDLDPKTEVITLIGSKEGIGHIPLAFINPGEKVLIPDPGYPVYLSGTIFAGGKPQFYALKKRNGFLPNLSTLEKKVCPKTKLMFLNYPNNPTGATVTVSFFEQVVEFAKRHNLIICHDAAYTEISFDGYQPPSFLQAKGAKEVGIEFHSLSKTFNMTGWRIGFAVGNPEILSGLLFIKSNLDSGVFGAIQEVGIAALTGDMRSVQEMREIYQRRRDVLVSGLESCGIKVNKPLAGFYVWVAVPQGYTSMEFTEKLIQEAGIVTTPGIGFGQYGEGYIRMTLTTAESRLAEAVDRIAKIKI